MYTSHRSIMGFTIELYWFRRYATHILCLVGCLTDWSLWKLVWKSSVQNVNNKTRWHGQYFKRMCVWSLHFLIYLLLSFVHLSVVVEITIRELVSSKRHLARDTQKEREDGMRCERSKTKEFERHVIKIDVIFPSV